MLVLTKPVRVLIVEDNLGDAALIRQALEDERAPRYLLRVAQTLADGLAALAEASFDVAVVDLNLPDCRGLEILERVTAQSPALPVVVLTARDDAALGRRAVDAGAADFLVKGWALGGGANGWRSLARSRQDRDPLVKGQRHGAFVRLLHEAIDRHPSRKRTKPDRDGAPRARTVAFLGVKGGVGTTTLALTSARAFAGRSACTVAVELRRTFGSFSTVLEQRPEHDLLQLTGVHANLLDEKAVRDCLHEVIPNLSVLFGPQRLGAAPDLDPLHVRVLMRRLADIARVVVVDLPSDPTNANREVLATADHTVLVFGPDHGSVVAGRAVLDLLDGWGVPRERLGVALAGPSALLAPETVARFEAAVEAPLIAVVPHARENAWHAGAPGADLDPSWAATRDLVECLDARHAPAAIS